MNSREWLTALLLAGFFGAIVGWSARALVGDHINTPVEHIQENKGDIARERKNK